MKSNKNLSSSLLLGSALILGATVLTCPAYAGYPEGYYDSLNGKCGAALMNAVKAVAQDHKEISYGNSTWDAFKSTDVRNVNGVDCWWDMYSNDNVSVSSGHPGMNIEHSVANSWWEGTKNAAYKDIVHLNPSNADANNRKSNYPLGEIGGSPTYNNGVTFVGHPKSGLGGGADYVYEPCDEYKGDFARVFMYMFTIYRDMQWGTRFTWMYDTSKPLMFKDWARTMLLEWNAADPVSPKERNRNDGIQKEQRNRNPFIDLPDLADHIWGSKSTVPFSVNGGENPNPDPGTDPDPDPDPDPEVKNTYLWLSEDDTDMGEWLIYDEQLPDASSYVWSWKSYSNKQYLNGSAFVNNTPYAAKSYAWSPGVSMTDVTSAKLTFDHAAKFQTTCKDLCKLVVMNHDVNSTDQGYITEYDITEWPAAGSWTFTRNEEFDLWKYSGHTISVGFKYESTSSGADTWEIRNVKLELTRAQSGVNCLPQEFDDSELVEVWGNNILVPQGAHIFDLNGREFDGTGLNPGLYIVTKPSFGKAVKVMIK